MELKFKNLSLSINEEILNVYSYELKIILNL